ncbi:F-box/FBD/LRR-repeat protein At1g13570-like [Silene latifolia]|uniref:F-box/FBD/LRR-repeat protein At1g13570-like n=1 Tax=Silene latifolia TaxID=37657 RepID=UPI003D76ED8E
MMTDCNNPKHGRFNSMDRLSDLPDFIIHQIISYLGTEEAYRTSVLSKRWNQIFATNPILDFYHYDFPTDMIPRYLEYIDTRMQKFSKENLRVKTFKLALGGTELLLGCKVDEWLEIALRNRVGKIVLEGPADYKLPRILFSAKLLTHLDIAKVEIPYYEAVDLVSLESLALGEVVVEERMLFHIVSSCLLLKDLSISFCTSFKNLVIPRHSKLEDLYIEGDVPKDGRVILETSSLRSFRYYTNGVNPWPIISDRGLLKNLRDLSVTYVSITGEDLAKLLLELTSLENMEFISCEMLTSIKISHTQLKKICFYECDNLLNVVIDAPNLKKFKFKYHGEIDSIIIHSQANCNVFLHTMASNFKTDGFFILKKLLTGLNNCSVLKIFLFDERVESPESGEDDIEFDEEESGNAELGPPCDIGELKLNLSHCQLSSSSILAFLNGLFWTCHPPIITLQVDPGHYNLKVEPLLDNLVDVVNCHPLKWIEVERTNDDFMYLEVQLRLCW